MIIFAVAYQFGRAPAEVRDTWDEADVTTAWAFLDLLKDERARAARA